MRKELLIYNDLGVSEFFLPLLKSELGSFFKVSYIDKNKLLGGNWIKSTDTILIPGGRDLYYHRELEELGNSLIRKFVEGGGNYIGICAGAYYGSSSIEFAKGTSLEIIEERYLKLTDAIATGPVLGLAFSYESNKTGRNLEIIYKSQNLSLTLDIYYNGGCTFKGIKDYIALAFYKSEKEMPAIIYKKYGKGKVVLSGVHLECPLIDEKLHQKIKRQKIIADILKLLGH